MKKKVLSIISQLVIQYEQQGEVDIKNSELVRICTKKHDVHFTNWVQRELRTSFPNGEGEYIANHFLCFLPACVAGNKPRAELNQPRCFKCDPIVRRTPPRGLW